MTAPHFDHIGLSVGDLDAQRSFYAQALGLTDTEETFELPEAQVRTAILRGADGLKLELVERGGSTPQEFADPLDGASVRAISTGRSTSKTSTPSTPPSCAPAPTRPPRQRRPSGRARASPTSRTRRATCSS